MLKTELVAYLTYLALEVGFIDSEEVCNDLSISKLKHSRALSSLKNMLYEREINDIEIIYSRSLKKHITYRNK